jgi:hypothetical protein
LDLATDSVSAISSAGSGSGARLEQRVHLRNRSVDAPAGAHFSPVEDEALHDGGEVHIRLFLLFQK